MATFTPNPAARRNAKLRLIAGVVAAARLYQRELKRVVSRPGRQGRSSAPGQPPESDTGGYRESIRLNLSKVNGTPPVASVESTGDLPRELEFGKPGQAPRPHWIPTFNRMRGTMLKQAAAAMRRGQRGA